MVQLYSEDAVRQKVAFADNFEKSVERDRAKEKAEGNVDPRVEQKRHTLFTHALQTLD